MTNPHFTDLPIEFYNEVNDDTTLQDEVEDRIRELAKGNTDITAAQVHIRKYGLNDDPFEATVSASVRPAAIAATETGRSAEAALKGALDAFERQVRDQREKLRGY